MSRRATQLRAAVAVLACVPAVALGGCGLGAGEASSGIALRVSDDFGRAPVAIPEPPKQEGEDTVMRLLQRNAKIETRYGGGFVQSINGLAGETSAERQVDWFFYVNGILAGRGSAAWKLADGERIWWDRHRWETAEVSAVVGDYPEPMKSGHGGKYKGALLDCRAATDTCDAAEQTLQDEGITVTRGAASDPDAQQTRVVVGAWPTIRDAAPELASLEGGPEESGVFARISGASGNPRITALRATETGAAGEGVAVRGLLAALRAGDVSPLWVITGVDEPAVDSALKHLSVRALRGRMAAVADGPQAAGAGVAATLRSLPLADGS